MPRSPVVNFQEADGDHRFDLGGAAGREGVGETRWQRKKEAGLFCGIIAFLTCLHKAAVWPRVRK